MKNIFESKPVNHSCMGPFPEGLKKNIKNQRRSVESKPEGIEVI